MNQEENKIETQINPCKVNLKFLSGCYGWIGNGTDPANVKTRAIGFFYFGSNGDLSGSYEGSYGGMQVYKTFTGTVTINGNSYGEMHFIDNAGFPLNFDFVIVNNGKELYLINKDDKALQTLTAKRVE